MNSLLLALAMLQSAATGAPPPQAAPGEEAVAPYIVSDSNAGTTPFSGAKMAQAFHGKDGIQRIVEHFATLNETDPVIGDIFKGHDPVRFRRTVFEQFCYILNAGCHYSGRDMKSVHKDLGNQQGDMNRVVENLQHAMREEGVSFPAQNRFLAKLAPMRRDIVTR